MAKDVWITPGVYSWFLPSGVNSVTVRCWGGGGGGFEGSPSSFGGGGGGGGAYASSFFVGLPENTQFTVTVGSGGLANSYGEITTVDDGSGNVCSADCGNAGAYNLGGGGGQAANCLGQTVYDGGHGGDAAAGGGGGGGGAAGTLGAGLNGGNAVDDAPGAGGAGLTLYGGNGGEGGSGNYYGSGTLTNGIGGFSYGGGGGGAAIDSGPTPSLAGVGAHGRAEIEFVLPSSLISNYFPLFTKGYDVSSGSLELFISGTNATGFYNNILLFTQGSSQSNSGLNLFINSDNNFTGSIPLFTQGNVNSTNNLNLYLLSSINETGNLPLFINGNLNDSGNFVLYTKGVAYHYSSPTLFIKAVDVTNVTGNIPLFIDAGTSSGSTSYYKTIPLFLHARNHPNNITLFIDGGISNTHSNRATLYISGVGTNLVSNIPLFIASSGSYTTIPMYIRGMGYGSSSGVNDGFYPFEGNTNLFIKRPIADALSFFIKDTLQSGTLGLFIKAYPYQESGIPNYVYGSDIVTNAMKLYTHGF